MAEIVFAICETKHVEIVIINQSDERSFEEELASDVLEIVTVFSVRFWASPAASLSPSPSASQLPLPLPSQSPSATDSVTQ